MGISIGNKNLVSMYVGNKNVEKIFIGNKLAYSSQTYINGYMPINTAIPPKVPEKANYTIKNGKAKLRAIYGMCEKGANGWEPDLATHIVVKRSNGHTSTKYSELDFPFRIQLGGKYFYNAWNVYHPLDEYDKFEITPTEYIITTNYFYDVRPYQAGDENNSDYYVKDNTWTFYPRENRTNLHIPRGQLQAVDLGDLDWNLHTVGTEYQQFNSVQRVYGAQGVYCWKFGKGNLLSQFGLIIRLNGAGITIVDRNFMFPTVDSFKEFVSGCMAYFGVNTYTFPNPEDAPYFVRDITQTRFEITNQALSGQRTYFAPEYLSSYIGLSLDFPVES